MDRYHAQTVENLLSAVFQLIDNAADLDGWTFEINAEDYYAVQLELQNFKRPASIRFDDQAPPEM